MRVDPPPSQVELSLDVPLLTAQQEDAIIHTRIINDEKALRRVTKKFHNYTSVAHNPVVPPSPAASVSAEDAREAFLVELASFHLSLQKNLLVCEAEARQVEEYHQERDRIANEHVRLEEQIEELKISLEHAQLERRRKMEYDVVAEKIATLPSREELELTIDALENDMAAIRTEHEMQDRILQAQKAALDVVISDLGTLRSMGKDDADESSRPPSPALDTSSRQSPDIELEVGSSQHTRAESGELKEDDTDRDSEDDIPLAKTVLNPNARSFLSRTTTPILASLRSTPASIPPFVDIDNDIEMGELAEESDDVKMVDVRIAKKKIREEELEEGEASDSSSELSEPPDD